MAFMQAVPLSARKAPGGSGEGIAPFLQLPHFSENVAKKISRKVFPYNDVLRITFCCITLTACCKIIIARIVISSRVLLKK